MAGRISTHCRVAGLFSDKTATVRHRIARATLLNAALAPNTRELLCARNEVPAHKVKRNLLILRSCKLVFYVLVNFRRSRTKKECEKECVIESKELYEVRNNLALAA